jgi:hypothetical protein
MTPTDTLDRVRFRGNPIAHPNALFTIGNARFTFLTPRLVRLEWSPDGVFEDRSTYAFPTRYTEPPRFFTRLEGNQLMINTDSLYIVYTYSEGAFAPKNLAIEFTLNGETKTWRPGLPNPGNLRGARRTLDGCMGDASLQEGLLSREGWSLFDDSHSVVYSEEGWVTARPEGPRQDWYFFGYGHDYQTALSDYTLFGGGIPLIPRFVLGAWWSRYWAYSEADLKELVGSFESHGLPLDVLVIDMDWHTPDAWTGYTWNRKLFPDPPAFLRWAHSKGLRTTLNLHPAEGIQAFEEVYPRFAQAMGIDPDSRKGVPFRIANPTFVRNYFELIHHPMEDDGVDFWWIDWQQGESSEVKGLDPLTWLNHLHYRDATRQGKRPLIYSRWGGLGNHRYQIGFSGDTVVVWPALQFQPYFTATAANVCFGWWTHDIGGHMGGATEPELYARWVQFGALSPVLRLHSTKDPLAERRPWIYPEPVFQAARTAFQWRYQLIPYLYSMARVAFDTGIALVRPMYYAYPEQEEAYTARYQYFLGDQMIAAPIVFPADPATGLAATDVWVPEGQWTDYTTKETFSGPGWVRILGDLNRVPMLVKSGGILPLAAPFTPQPNSPVMASGATNSLPKDKLILAVFPGPEGRFRLYEDDGESSAFEQGQFEWTEITTRMPQSSIWEVTISPVEGSCDALPAARSYEIRLEGSQVPTKVSVNGMQINQWTYQPETLTTVISVPPTPKNQAVTVNAFGAGSLSALDGTHNLTLALEDAQRVLGKALPDRITSLPALLEYVLGQEFPGKRDLVARLGGPLVRFIEFVTEEEASQQLGRVILGLPRNEPCQVDIDMNLAGADPQHFHFVDAGPSLIVNTPFACNGKLKASQWQAKVDVTWRGYTFTYRHQSLALFPAVTTWHSRLYHSDTDVSPILQTVKNASQLPAAKDWTVYTEDPHRIENLAYPFYMQPWQDSYQKVVDGQPVACCLATTILSEAKRQACLLFFSKDPVVFYINGEKLPPDLVLAGGPALPFSMHPDLRVAVRVGPFHLRQGENTLVVDIHPTPGSRPSWIYTGMLVSTDGQILPDLEYR